MPNEPIVIDAEKKLQELSASLDTMRTSLLGEVEKLRGKDREEIQASIAEVTTVMAGLKDDLKRMQEDKLPGLEVVDPKKHRTERAFKDKFSLHRYTKALVKTAMPHCPVDIGDCGYEIEAMNQMSLKKKGATAFEVIQHASQNVGQDSAGGVFVPQEVSTAMIPELVAQMVAARAGVQVLTGLVGNMSWPKKVSGVVGQWLDTEAEQSITTETLVFGVVNARPHPYAAAVPITWLALQQPSVSIEGLVRQDFAEKLGLLHDKANFLGTGQQGQPRGVYNHGDIGSVSWSGVQFGSAALTGGLGDYDNSLDKLRDHYHQLREANAVGNGQSLGWVAAPDALLKFEKAKDLNGMPMYLTKDQPQVERLIGYPVHWSTALDQSDAAEFFMFGKWNEMIDANWGGLQFAVSDSHASNFLTGVVVIRAIGSSDVVVRQPTAFSKATSFSAA